MEHGYLRSSPRPPKASLVPYPRRSTLIQWIISVYSPKGSIWADPNTYFLGTPGPA
jgi:hypothetical protein